VRDDLEQLVTLRIFELRHEISQHRDTEWALNQSREKYRTVIETAAEGFWMVNTLLTAVDVNEALCRLLGYRREEIVGHSLLTFVAPVSRAAIKDHVITTLWQG